MKKRNCVLCLMGVATVLTLAACHGKKSSPKEDDNQEKIAEAKKEIPVSAEDSAICVDVFTRYLNVPQEYAEEAAGNAASLMDDADIEYQKNKVHVDSMFHNCIDLVKERKYNALLDRLEKERINIYQHPGNLLDNELGLVKVFSILYNGMYSEAEDSFYVKMLPAYEFCKTHMEMLEMMGQERHPDYEQLDQLISHARTFQQ